MEHKHQLPILQEGTPYGLTQRIQSGTIKAVHFDLDDTLFDHQYSSRSGLAALTQRYDSLGQVSLDELERLHAALLNELHMEVLRGKATIDEMRTERFRRIFLHYGEQVSPAIIQEAVMLYREAYKNARRAISGVVPLLQALHFRVHIAIVTNSILVEQQEKLRICGLTSLVDTLVVSEEVGSIKPEAAIFEITLQRIGCSAHEAIMIGDSWKADVIGAQGVGIQAIWLTPIFKLPALQEQLHKIAYPSLFVIGSADPHYKPDLIKEIQEATGGEVLVIEGADHGLLIQGDVFASIHGMERVIRSMQSLLEQQK